MGFRVAPGPCRSCAEIDRRCDADGAGWPGSGPHAVGGSRIEASDGKGVAVRAGSDRPSPTKSPTLIAPGILLGVGLGGFVDGILLHQVLQWHHMVSEDHPPTSLENAQINMTADGFFHTFVWIAVAVGLALLWHALRAGRPWTWRTLLGWMLVGWGLFNLVEGIIDHHLLQIHRVKPDAADPMLWDLGFLLFGALLLVGGWLLARSDRPVHAYHRRQRG